MAVDMATATFKMASLIDYTGSQAIGCCSLTHPRVIYSKESAKIAH